MNANRPVRRLVRVLPNGQTTVEVLQPKVPHVVVIQELNRSPVPAPVRVQANLERERADVRSSLLGKAETNERMSGSSANWRCR